jgi:hypothetical protein
MGICKKLLIGGDMAKISWSRLCGLGLLALGLALCQPAWADMQAKLNVVGSALARSGQSISSLAVAGFTDAGSGDAALAQALEDGLRKAVSRTKKLKVLPASADPSKAAALLTGTYSAQDGGLAVHVLLQDASGTPLGFTRDLVLASEDLQAAGLSLPAASAPAAAEQEPLLAKPALVDPYYSGQAIPTLSPRAPRRPGRPFHVDVSAGYKAFFPTNSTFAPWIGGRADGASMGLSFNDWVLVDVDYWHANINGMGTVDGLDYFGTDLAITYPMRFGPLTFYLGPGGRFADLQVHDTAVNDDSDQASFGNNALTAVVGAKLRYDMVGLDLRYAYDLVSSYTGYHTVRLGGFLEFGR